VHLVPRFTRHRAAWELPPPLRTRSGSTSLGDHARASPAHSRPNSCGALSRHLPCRQDQPAQSKQYASPLGRSSAIWLRCRTRKQPAQVNSSDCRGSTRTVNSSWERSAPGSSNASAASASSSSTFPEFLSLRRVLSSSVLHRSCEGRRNRSPSLPSRARKAQDLRLTRAQSYHTNQPVCALCLLAPAITR
jgi:hypothetical protein